MKGMQELARKSCGRDSYRFNYRTLINRPTNRYTVDRCEIWLGEQLQIHPRALRVQLVEGRLVVVVNLKV